MPSCSGNHKQAPMTGGGIRSMLRRAKSGLRKLTKRNKPAPKPLVNSYEMEKIKPTIASTRFGSKSKYNNRAAHRQGVADLEQYVKQLQEEVKELTQQSDIAQTAHGQCMDREAKRLGNPALTKELEAAVSKLAKAEKQLETERAEVKRLYEANGIAERTLMQKKEELAEANAKLTECESGKASLGRRHVNRTLGALDTEDALNKASEAEKLLAIAREQLATLQDKYTSATQHAGTKSEKITELGVKLNAANAKVTSLESNLVNARAFDKKKSIRRRFAQNIAHGALSIMQKRASVKRQSAAKTKATLDNALSNLNKLNEEYNKSVEINGTNTEQNMQLRAMLDKANDKVNRLQAAIGSTERKLASAERRKQQASSRAANLELESDVLKAQYAAAAERLENDTLKRSQELKHKNNLLAAARNQFADVEANRKLKSKAAELVKNNMFSRRLTVGVQNLKSSKKSRQSNWFASGGHATRG